MNASSDPHFLSPHQPWLPQLAKYLLSRAASAQKEDALASTVLLLPSRRGCERLLQLMSAFSAQPDPAIPSPWQPGLVVLPRAMTPWEALPSLLELPTSSSTSRVPAGPFLSRLAWQEAMRLLPDRFTPPAISGTSEQLVRLAQETHELLSTTDFSFNLVAQQLLSWRPDLGEETLLRWEFLARLQQQYRDLLREWGVIDSFDYRRLLVTQGEKVEGVSVIACGLFEHTPLLKRFLAKIKPELIVIAESEGQLGADRRHLAGEAMAPSPFGPQGELCTEYWQARFFPLSQRNKEGKGAATHQVVALEGIIPSLSIAQERITPCQDAATQAAHLKALLQQLYPHKTVPYSAIALPERGAYPTVMAAFAGHTPPMRWAGGRSLRGHPLVRLFQLLGQLYDTPLKEGGGSDTTIVADRPNGTDGADEAASFFPKRMPLAPFLELLEHPEIARNLPQSVAWYRRLVRWQREKLLEELPHWQSVPPCNEESEKETKDNEKSEGLPLLECQHLHQELLVPLRALLGISPQKQPFSKRMIELQHLLLRLLKTKAVLANSPAGSYLLGALEKIEAMIAEGAHFSSLSRAEISEPRLSPHAFFEQLYELLSEEEVAFPEDPQAYDLIGWGELAIDDAPIAIILSVHEGVLPHLPQYHPMVPLWLGSFLGLPSREELLVRDAYLLYLITSSRKENGYYHLFAPLRNSQGDPTRPSRLLTLGESLESLPQRLLFLQKPIPLSDSIFREKIVTCFDKSNNDYYKQKEKIVVTSSQSEKREFPLVKIERLSVTSLKTYLKSPQLFYWLHLRNIRELTPPSAEIEASQLGSFLHLLLQRFGSTPAIAASHHSDEIFSWLARELEELYKQEFWHKKDIIKKRQLSELKRVLKGFSDFQAKENIAGWQIIATESPDTQEVIEKPWKLSDGREVFLYGKIDRLDWHPQKQRWRIIDYKTGSSRQWQRHIPTITHYQKRGEEIIWKDLQLPLYLYLLDYWRKKDLEGLSYVAECPPTSENTDLTYFQLPIEPWGARITPSFPPEMVAPAWQMTEKLLHAILDANFEEKGVIDNSYSIYLKELIETY